MVLANLRSGPAEKRSKRARSGQTASIVGWENAVNDTKTPPTYNPPRELLEYLDPEGKIMAGKYTTFSSSIGHVLQNYCTHQVKLHFLYKPEDAVSAIPVMLH